MSIADKKIALDITFLQDQYANRGIGRYGKEIFGRLLRHSFLHPELNLKLHLIGFGKLEDNLKLLPTELDAGELLKLTEKIEFYSLGRARNSSPIPNIITYFTQIVPLINQIKPDLYWAVHFDRGLPTKLVPTIVAIHDVIPLITGKFSSKGKLVNFLKGIYYKLMWHKVKSAKLVFTSSNFSKHDLQNYGELSPAQIEVVYLGVSEVFQRAQIPINTKQQIEILNRYDIQTIVRAGQAQVAPYLLYDGGLEQNKNISKLIQIFAKVISHFPDLKLIITSGDFKYNPRDKTSAPLHERAVQLVDQAAELGVINNIIPTGRLSDTELAIMLAQSRAYINLSSYEGFGFGPVQAMASGVPAITSNLSCFPEILGDGALMINPDNILESAAKIIELLSNESARRDLIEIGSRIAPEYNWESTFMQTWEKISSEQPATVPPVLKLRHRPLK